MAAAGIIMKDPLVQYYFQRAGRESYSGIGPIYSVPPFVHRVHGIGSYFSGLFRLVRPVIWSAVKTVGRQTLRTGDKILWSLANNTSCDVKPRHIIAKHVSESAQNLIQKLRGKGLKRTSTLHSRGLPPKKKAKK